MKIKSIEERLGDLQRQVGPLLCLKDELRRIILQRKSVSDPSLINSEEEMREWGFAVQAKAAADAAEIRRKLLDKLIEEYQAEISHLNKRLHQPSTDANI